MRTFSAPSGATVSEIHGDGVSVVWSWRDEYDDFGPYEHRLTWIIDEVGLYFETKNPAGRWVGTPIRHPDYQAANLAQAREMAHKFITAGDDS